MSLYKQAKVLSNKQFCSILSYLDRTRYPLRNKVMFLLSFKGGLRAKEIAELKWSHVLDSSFVVGDTINLSNDISKGSSGGRIIPMNKELRSHLVELYNGNDVDENVVLSERCCSMSSRVIRNFFKRMYDELGYHGCTSHSGRRTFATNVSRNVSRVGGSLYDVQTLLGHSHIQTTMRYLERDSDAQQKVVQLI